jgi:hypothetical protein
LISQPTSVKSRPSISGDPPESTSKPNSNISNGHVAVANRDPSTDPAITPKPPSKPTVAKQEAAIVASHQQHTISQSSSSTLPKEQVFTTPTPMNIFEAAMPTRLPTTHEDSSFPGIVKPAFAPISVTSNPVTELPSLLNSTVVELLLMVE